MAVWSTLNIILLVSHLSDALRIWEMPNHMSNFGELPPNSLPSIVRMRIGTERRCVGTIVNDEWILTAGHCCVKEAKTTPEDPADISFAIGVHYDDTCDYTEKCGPYHGVNGDAVGEVINAKNVVLHPDYKLAEISGGKIIGPRVWDFCLVQVEKMELEDGWAEETNMPVQKSGLSYVLQKSYSPVSTTQKASRLMNDCIVAGWGKGTRNNKQSPILVIANTTVLSNTFCNEKTLKSKLTTPIQDDQFCATITESSSLNPACGADSGSPLYCYKNNKYVQYGVLSWSPQDWKIQCGSETGKSPGNPTVYGNTAEIQAWIKITTQKTPQKSYPRSITISHTRHYLKTMDDRKMIRGKYVKQNDEEGGAPVYLKKRSRTHNVCSVIFRSIEGDKAFWQISKCGFVSNGKKWDEHGWKDISFKKQVFILKSNNPIDLTENLLGAHDWKVTSKNELRKDAFTTGITHGASADKLQFGVDSKITQVKSAT